MSADTVERMKRSISRLDWSLLKGSAVITVGMILARGVGFIVSFLQARFFDPMNFGVIQYAVSLAGLLAIGMQPLGQHVIARYVGMGRDKPEELQKTLSNIWFMLIVVFCVSIFLGVPILLVTGKFNSGILVIFFGTSIYYAYWGLARGYLASSRLVIVDVGNNFIQVLLIIWLIGILGMKSTLLAMFIQGLSCFVPLIFLQSFWPLPIIFRRELISKTITKNIFKFSMPVWLSHASYMLYTNVAILFLEHYMGNTTVGIFSLAGTLSILFSFFPTGLSTYLMPKIAGASGLRHRELLVNALGMAMLINISLLVVYFFTAPWLVEKLFGLEYLAVPGLFILMAIVMTMNGTYGIITSVFVGSGRAHEETKSRLMIVLVTVIGCWLLIPKYGILGAAWAMLIGIVSGFGVYGLIYLWGYFHRTRH